MAFRNDLGLDSAAILSAYRSALTERGAGRLYAQHKGRRGLTMGCAVLIAIAAGVALVAAEIIQYI